MARIFTSNQVNHVYVVKGVKTQTNPKTKLEDLLTNVGDILVDKDMEGNLFMSYKGHGGIVRTDLLENIMYAKKTIAAAMRQYYTDSLIRMQENVKNGADYILNIEMQNPMGMSPDNVYIQNAVARAFSGDTKSDIYVKLAENLKQNFNRLDTKLFNIYMTVSTIPTSSAYSATSTYSIGDMVSITNDNLTKYYVCHTAIGSGEAFNSSKWTEVDINAVNLGATSFNGSASKGDIVTYKGLVYICKTDTSTAWNASNFVNIMVDETANAYGQYTEYSSSTEYALGTSVKYSNGIYVNKSAITGGGEAWNSAHWYKVAEDVTNTNINHSTTYEGIMLESQPTEWIRGIKQDKPLIYNISSDIVSSAHNNTEVMNVPWAEVTNFKGIVLKNGHAMADLEYFAMGERGDQYRMSGWPDYIPTKYVLTDADAEGEFDTVGIHYAYVGSNEAVQKSEKDITFICSTSVTSDFVTAINNVKEGTIPA